LVLRYTYDPSQGFLIREDNAYANETYLYTYDEMGNMLTKKTYGLDFSSNPFDLLESESFSYAQSSLGKRYGEWNSYDALGNLTFDDDKAWSYTWDGRQLVDITEDGGSPQFTFDYNADGIRTRKGITDYGDEWTYHSYTLDGTTIVKETIYFESYGMVVSSRDIYYYYDENGAPLGLNWNNTNYYYYKNIFGDVLGIMNSNGTMVVRYAYDAWGNPISTTGAMANTLGQDNPFRYRGYYYDTETGLYYLNARYYNPEWGRFISIDPVLDTSSSVGCNMFAYCGNDPVNYFDPSGNLKQGLTSEQIRRIFESAEYMSKYQDEQDIIYWCQYPSEEDLIYAATIYAESGGENLLSKKAVASVMWNRFGTGGFGKTIVDVLSAPDQFDGYMNGNYKRAMMFYNTGTVDNRIDEKSMRDCLQVAVTYYHGMGTDTTGGALYFHSFYEDPTKWTYHYHYTMITVEGVKRFVFYK